MKIAHITDLHVGHKDEYPYEIDVRSNFINVLKSVISEKCEYIIVTGDLCNREPTLDIYSWIKKPTG